MLFNTYLYRYEGKGDRSKLQKSKRIRAVIGQWQILMSLFFIIEDKGRKTQGGNTS